jgi:hypothetical protein
VCLFRIIFYFFQKYIISYSTFSKNFKFYFTKSNLVIRAVSSNNIQIQHPNGPTHEEGKEKKKEEKLILERKNMQQRKIVHKENYTRLPT